MNTKMTKKEFDKLLANKLFSEFAADLSSATDEQIWKALEIAQAKEFVQKLPLELDSHWMRYETDTLEIHENMRHSVAVLSYGG